MKSVFKFFSAVLAGLAITALTAALAAAQVPSIPNPPYNSPVSPPNSQTPTATKIITNTLQTVGTVSTNIGNNLAYGGIICTYNQTASSGTPKEQLAVDAYDEASGQYVQWAIAPASAAAFTAPVSIEIFPGIQTSTLPTGMVALNLHLPRFFRVREIITDAGSTGAAVTGTVGCDLLR